MEGKGAERKRNKDNNHTNTSSSSSRNDRSSCGGGGVSRAFPGSDSRGVPLERFPMRASELDSMIELARLQRTEDGEGREKKEVST